MGLREIESWDLLNIKEKKRFIENHDGLYFEFFSGCDRLIKGFLMYESAGEYFFIRGSEIDPVKKDFPLNMCSYFEDGDFFIDDEVKIPENFSSKMLVENVRHPQTNFNYDLRDDFPIHLPNSRAARS